MPLWIERYILPICAAIIVGLVILNPLKLDWQQRVALLVAISAFAYFLAHTIHKPKAQSATAIAPDLRIGVLEQQVQDLKSQQERFLDKEKESKAQEKRKSEIQDHLSKLIAQGTRLRDEWQTAISVQQTEQQQKGYAGAVQKWHDDIVAYLKTIPRSGMYLARFQSGTRATGSYPSGILLNQAGYWDRLMSDLGKLNEFITDQDLGKP